MACSENQGPLNPEPCMNEELFKSSSRQLLEQNLFGICSSDSYTKVIICAATALSTMEERRFSVKRSAGSVFKL